MESGLEGRLAQILGQRSLSALKRSTAVPGVEFHSEVFMALDTVELSGCQLEILTDW